MAVLWEQQCLQGLPRGNDRVILSGDGGLDKDRALTWISLPAFHPASVTCQRLCAQCLLSEMACTGNQAANHCCVTLETALKIACGNKNGNKKFTLRRRNSQGLGY